MSANAQDLILGALGKLRVKKTGFDPTSDELNDGLNALNRMLGAWGNEVYLAALVRDTLTLSIGVNPHTIGTGGVLNTVQPTEIHYVTLVDGSGDSVPLTRMTLGQYDALQDKTETSQPTRYEFEPGATLGNLYFDYIPDAAYTVVIDSEKPLTRFAALTTSNTLTDDAEAALIYNLAIELAPEYGKEPSPTTVRLAGRYLRTLKRKKQSQHVPKLKSDAVNLSRTRRGYFNINVIR